MGTKAHWEAVYASKPHDAFSWYRPHLETSLALIERVAGSKSASIIDVGGGESTLVDDLLARGYQDITVLDISQIAIDATKTRIHQAAEHIRWMCGDVTAVDLALGAYDVWHDRAVFHFLTSADARLAYVRNLARAVKKGGHVIVSTFGPDGPKKCSGLDVVRYSAERLAEEFGSQFRLLESSTELHQTPFGTTQQFLSCCFRAE